MNDFNRDRSIAFSAPFEPMQKFSQSIEKIGFITELIFSMNFEPCLSMLSSITTSRDEKNDPRDSIMVRNMTIGETRVQPMFDHEEQRQALISSRKEGFDNQIFNRSDEIEIGKTDK